MCNTYTIEQLNDACLKIEASFEPKTKDQSNSNHKKGRNSDLKQSKEKKQERRRDDKKNERADKGTYSCYRCERKGHVAKFCKAKSKPNGDPCNPKPNKKEETVGSIGQEEQNVEEAKTQTPSTSHVANKIRAAGSNSINTVQINNINKPLKSLITHKVICNGLEVEAQIDTGAAVSVIHYELVARNQWKMKKSSMQLIHAAGDRMGCEGEIEAEIEITIGQKSMSTRYTFQVVKNLCAPILVVLELMKTFKVIINPMNNPPLSFQKGLFKKGVRLQETLVVPARHLMVVKGEVCTSASIVATLPFHFDNSIMVANTVSKVMDSAIQVVLLNLDTWDVEIKKQQQIASFQTLSDQTEMVQSWGVFNVLPLGDTSSFVKVGDNLTHNELNDLSQLLSQYTDAFATDGKIGFTRELEHKIELVPGAKPFREKARRHPRHHEQEAKRQIQEMLQEGIIETSESPWCSEYVMVKKKTNDWRLCVDFRKLNTLTKKDSVVVYNSAALRLS